MTTDADGQYDLTELPLLLEPLVAGEADFVTGSRQLGVNHATDPVRRWYLQLQASRMFEYEKRVSLAAGHIVAVSKTDADE